MKRILFVDDEPRILDGLKRMLRVNRREWDMTFVESGEAALSAFAEKPFDVVVSDMRMPGMDGAALLARLRDEYPDTVRIVLSGFAELEAALRAIPVAHQFINKPCDADTIKDVINRACGLHELLQDSALRSAVGKIDSLPALPRVYTALVTALADPGTGVGDISRIIEQDISMSAKIVQTANSGFFGTRKQMTSISQAVNHLGLTMVKNLALSVEVFRAHEAQPIAGVSIQDLHNHALQTAAIAGKIHPDRKRADDAFLAGMLHDIGKLILVSELPEQFAEIRARMNDTGRSMHVAETGLNRVSHAEIGAYLLSLWGMPYPIVEAVAYHHAPGRVARADFGILGAVHVANVLAHEVAPDTAASDGGSAPIDMEYLETTGMNGRLDAWRSVAAEVAQAQQGGVVIGR